MCPAFRSRPGRPGDPAALPCGVTIPAPRSVPLIGAKSARPGDFMPIPDTTIRDDRERPAPRARPARPTSPRPRPAPARAAPAPRAASPPLVWGLWPPVPNSFGVCGPRPLIEEGGGPRIPRPPHWNSMPLRSWTAARRHVRENRTQVTLAPSASRSARAGPVERYETPDPVRSDAVKSRFHYVRQRTGRDPCSSPNSDRDAVLSLLVTFVSADAPGSVAGP